MKKLIMLSCVGILLATSGCMKSDSTKKFLERQGYTHVSITGWRPFIKSEKDWYSTGFSAMNVQSNIVSGAVTEGLLFKGKTIRFD